MIMICLNFTTKARNKHDLNDNFLGVGLTKCPLAAQVVSYAAASDKPLVAETRANPVFCNQIPSLKPHSVPVCHTESGGAHANH